MSAKRRTDDNLQSHWYPTESQVKDAPATIRAMKQILDQLYALQDSHDALRKQVAGAAGSATTPTTKSAASPTPPPGSGPADSMLLGLNVAPVDSTTLADGATLKYNKSSGNFEFS